MPAQAEVDAVVAMIRAGRYDEAAPLARGMILRHPDYARGHVLLGLTYHKQKQYGRAIDCFRAALHLSDDDAAAYDYLGWSLYYTGRAAEAATCFERVAALAPESPDGPFALGVLAFAANELAAAERRFLEAIRRASAGKRGHDEARARTRLADVLLAQERSEEARRQLELALVADPDAAGVRFKLGLIGRRAGTVAATPSRTADSGGLDIGTPRFVECAAAAGVDLTLTCGQMPSREILEVNGGGVALFDADNDGDPDLYFGNGGRMDAPQDGAGCRLYVNRGDGTFHDASAGSGADVGGWCTGVAVGDYDGDGRDDLYVTRFGPNVLLRNETAPGGSPRFRDVTAEAGVGDPCWGTSAAFGDLDGDGDLDLYVANYLEFDPQHPPSRAGKLFKGVNVMAGPKGLTPQADVLYENLGNGRFRDASVRSGCAAVAPGFGLVVQIIDLDGDGRQDIFVGNDSTYDFLFHNRGGGRFDEVGPAAGLATDGDGNPQATMGIAIGDVDGNGLPDAFTTAFSDDTNTLHVNAGSLTFEDRTSVYGLGLVSRPYLSWACGFYDFDADGDEDLFISNGHVYPETASQPMDTAWEQPPLLFVRTGERFALPATPIAAFERPQHGRATAFGDLDRDGDVDIVMTTLNGPVRIYRNDSTAGRRVTVRLRQAGANPRAYGSVVQLTAFGHTQRRWITGGGSYQSANAAEAYFGLGAFAGTSVHLRITWPDGAVTETRRPLGEGLATNVEVSR